MGSLHQAVGTGNVEEVQKLLERGTDSQFYPVDPDESGLSPVHLVAFSGSSQIYPFQMIHSMPSIPKFI